MGIPDPAVSGYYLAVAITQTGLRENDLGTCVMWWDADEKEWRRSEGGRKAWPSTTFVNLAGPYVLDGGRDTTPYMYQCDGCGRDIMVIGYRTSGITPCECGAGVDHAWHHAHVGLSDDEL